MGDIADDCWDKMIDEIVADDIDEELLKNGEVGKIVGYRVHGRSYDTDGNEVQEVHEEECTCCRKNLFQRTTPNPGSDEAVAQNCTCPQLDNAHGNPKLGEIRGFFITEGCPLHDKTTNNETK